MPYCVNRIYRDATWATAGGAFQDRVLLDDVGNGWRPVVDRNLDTELAAQDFGLSLRTFVYLVEPGM